ncbi:CPBP family intramembrane glutamic endopeptidase [Nocardia sp. CNY236]|uniref:CPBP family intramembrane glutamic endopeptidase n=1 Tax=Nocardia sp. CNY236 TaxID=1169152 RepID=UPI0003FF22AF|nr:CPBP family intramembrane glutamic endopeptidase [Nocardia sp. CNY236]
MEPPTAAPPTRAAVSAGIVLVFAAITSWWLVLTHGVDAVTGTEYTRGGHIVRAVGATLFAIPLTALVLRFPVPLRWSDLGLTGWRIGWKQFGFGAACWAVPALLTLSISVAAGWTEVTVRAPAAEIAVVLLGLTALVLLYEAIPEELVFRGYFFAVLAGRFAPVWAALGQAALFTAWGALISSEISIERMLKFALFAALLGALRAVTGSIWSGMGFHTAFQVTAQVFGESWPQMELHDPDLTVTAVAFVAVPFASTAILLWWRRRPRHASPTTVDQRQTQ